MQQPFLVSVKARNLLICPYLRLTAETKIVVPDGTALGFKPPAFNSFEIYLVHRSFLHISILC